jgi:hypothetical protein
MSMRVMKVKHNARIKTQQFNSRQPFSLSTTRGNEGGCNSVPVYQVDFSGSKIIRQTGPTNMCAGYGYIAKAPSRQQGYGLYLKRATMGLGGRGGLASKVVYYKDENGNNVPVQKTLTYKRPQSGGVDGFSSANHIDNVRSKALRCDYSQVTKEGGCQIPVGNGTSGGMIGHSQNPLASSHPCSNGCGKIPCITQNLGYLSASQQINKKLSQRGKNPGEQSTALTTNYESDMMKSSSDGTCG